MKRLIAISAFLLFAASPALAADTTRPSVGAPSPDRAVVNQTVVISASVSDAESGIASCRLYVDNDDVAGMNINGGTASVAYVFNQQGVHTVFVFCRDGAGNFNSGENGAMVVTGSGSSGDASPPSVSAVSPTTASSGASVSYSAQVSDTGTGVSSCQLIVNGFSAGNMAVSGGVASLPHTFDSQGGYDMQVQCVDGAGNTGTGPVTRININNTPLPPIAATGLVKLVCPANSDVTNPCRAVYYRSSDGKRHAFPNAKVYFTWYADFSGVKDISAAEMASLPLSKQVTYRPGSKLVKFTTLPKVYAVARFGKLRWVTTEAVAVSLYGANWNTKIDDIPDTFFVDYTFGDDIHSAADFSPTAEAAAAPTIEQNL